MKSTFRLLAGIALLFPSLAHAATSYGNFNEGQFNAAAALGQVQYSPAVTNASVAAAVNFNLIYGAPRILQTTNGGTTGTTVTLINAPTLTDRSSDPWLLRLTSDGVKTITFSGVSLTLRSGILVNPPPAGLNEYLFENVAGVWYYDVLNVPIWNSLDRISTTADDLLIRGASAWTNIAKSTLIATGSNWSAAGTTNSTLPGIASANGYVATNSITYNGSTSGTTIVKANAVAGGTFTLPASTGTLFQTLETDDAGNASWGYKGMLGAYFARIVRLWQPRTDSTAAVSAFGDTCTQTGTATFITGTSTLLPAVNLATTSTSNNVASFASAAAAYYFGRPHTTSWNVGTPDGTDARYHVSISNGSAATMGGAREPVSDYYGFVVETGVDTTWQAQTCDGSTVTTTDTGVTWNTNKWPNLTVKWTPAVSAVFYINGLPVATNTTHLPRNSIIGGNKHTVTCLNNAIVNIRMVNMEDQEDITSLRQ